MKKINAMSLKSFGAILPRASIRRIYTFAFARILANFLDIFGLAGIALLATSFGAFATGGGSANLDLPVIGKIAITEIHAIAIAVVVVFTFILKSGFSIWLNLRTALFVASIESAFSEKLAFDYFSGRSGDEKSFSDNLSEFQNAALISTTYLSVFINARISLLAELSLLGAMVGIFLVINPIATFATFAYLVAVMWVLGRIVANKIKNNGNRQLLGNEQALTSSRDMFGVRREIRIAGLLNHWVGKFADGRKESASASAVIYNLNGLPRYVIETSLILGIFGFLAGIVIFSDLPSQAVTIGVFMAGGLRLVASLLPLQSAINSMIDGANRGRPALERLVALSSQEIRDESAINLTNSSKPPSLEFSHVSFEFNTGSATLSDVSFTVEGGSKVALVGPSGAGKTTCFEIASGFRTPDSGSVILAGTAPRNILESGLGYIGLVPQRPHLVSGTLAENVTLRSHKDSDIPKVLECLRIAGLAKFSTTASLEMWVEPDAGQMSGGEIQRLGLARALYRDPKILFLDEATSALDAETEEVISTTLDQLKGKMTVVMIAHRLSTVKDADKIIYLSGGRKIAEGSFEELAASVPDFANAVRILGLNVSE